MGDFDQGAAYVDGQYLPVGEARIPLLDWGFLHSDATYDVAHVWRGRFFRIDDYIHRFQASMQKLRMAIDYDAAQIRDIMFELVRLSGLRDAYVEVVCTRGIPAPGSRDPRTCENRFLAFAIPFVWIADDAHRARGLDVLISRQQRIPPQAVDPRIKNYHWLDMTMALFEAYDRGEDTAVLVDADGNLVEGPGFNVFVRRGNTVITPERGVLQGVTRTTVLELLAKETELEVQPGLLPASVAMSPAKRSATASPAS
jgi:branched-chain amino acid aminotransferase